MESIVNIINQLEESIEDAQSQVRDAMNEADSARENAESANYYCDQADDSLGRAVSLLMELQEKSGEIQSDKLVKTLEKMLEQLKA